MRVDQFRFPCGTIPETLSETSYKRKSDTRHGSRDTTHTVPVT